MRCSRCGHGGVRWMGPLTNLTHTECPNCGGQNCQEPDEQPDIEADNQEGEIDG